MYYVERLPITESSFLAGSVAEPSATEVAWSGAGVAYAVGAEVVRTATHRVYRCAVAHTSAASPLPENDPTRWYEDRPTDRWVPFGPYINAAGQTIYRSLALSSTSTDLVYRLALRYANAVALFGLRGAFARVQVYDTPGGTLVFDLTMPLKRPAAGYWSYYFGQRSYRDRLLITGLPLHPNAEVVITVGGGSGQQRRVTQVEVGKLRQLHGVDFGGTEYGVTTTPTVRLYRQQETDGTEKVLIYGTSQDMRGRVVLRSDLENQTLAALRALSGKGVACIPSLLSAYEGRLTFGVIETAPVSSDSFSTASVDLSVRGLPVD